MTVGAVANRKESQVHKASKHIEQVRPSAFRCKGVEFLSPSYIRRRPSKIPFRIGFLAKADDDHVKGLGVECMAVRTIVL